MRFLFYKVVNKIMTKLNIKYTTRNSKDEKVAIASKYNLLYLSLFIRPSDKITDENIFELSNQINGISDSKKYASGSRSIPPENRKEYNDIDSLDAELMQVRFDFFQSLIQERGNILSVLDFLEKMVMDSANVADDIKVKILSAENDSLFQTLREKFAGNEQMQIIQIFKILVYSLYYSDARTPYDDLPSKESVHPNFIDRQETISKLNSAFTNNNIVYLCGIRGCGKTEISKKFISENNFYGILTLDYADDILESIEQEQFFCGKNKESNQELIKKMDSNYLLVIENVTKKLPDKFINFINFCNCKVLVLSSWRPRNERLTVVDVDCFSEEQAYELMSRYTSRFERDSILYIAKKLNYHALAMTVYAKAIEQSFFEYDDICGILHESTVSDKIEENVNYEDKEAKACEHIKRLFDFTFDNMNDDDKTVLRVMSLMPVLGVPVKLLHELTGLKNNNAVYCNLMPMGWLNINENTDRTITIHSIIRDIVIQKLKPDTENCMITVDYIYKNITHYWEYSINGILYRKIYFSVIKSILCLPSKDNFKIFDFIVKCISSLLTYGYTDEAKQIYDIAVVFIDKLKKEKEDFKFVLSAFDIHFRKYNSVNDFILATQQEYSNKIRKAENIRKLHNAINYEKIIMLYPYFYFANEYLKKLIDLLRKEHFEDNHFAIINAKFDTIYNYIYQNHENDVLIQSFFLEYNVLFYEFLASYETNTEAIEAYKHLLKQFNNHKSLEYLRTMYSYYVICKRLQPQKADSIAEKIKNLYSDGHFEYFKYDIISDIVEEFNLPHTEINSLEDE